MPIYLGFESPGVRHFSVWTVHVLPAPVWTLDYLYSSHIPKAYVWEKDEGMTLNSL